MIGTMPLSRRASRQAGPSPTMLPKPHNACSATSWLEDCAINSINIGTAPAATTACVCAEVPEAKFVRQCPSRFEFDLIAGDFQIFFFSIFVQFFLKSFFSIFSQIFSYFFSIYFNFLKFFQFYLEFVLKFFEILSIFFQTFFNIFNFSLTFFQCFLKFLEIFFKKFSQFFFQCG